ncbi:hypothetical protein B0T24DRAFT_633061 [Lasiosphaeria ovina]|uniref:Secreted protein n=1 Tax=Lasiosphaeria ovina TaxID=92902 RepID=A0AAE0K5B9_9PEZI|nr:hypothetical protein B0T24DRAFT_633061 [Lasiosphaeria ovina]
MHNASLLSFLLHCVAELAWRVKRGMALFYHLAFVPLSVGSPKPRRKRTRKAKGSVFRTRHNTSYQTGTAPA